MITYSIYILRNPMQQLLPDPSLVWDLGLRSPRLADGSDRRWGFPGVRDQPLAQVSVRGARGAMVGPRVRKSY